MNLLTAHLFAHLAEFDEGHAGAPDLEDWDWSRVDEELAELGDLTSTPGHVPTARFEVTSLGDAAAARFRCRGIGGYFLPRWGQYFP